MNELHLRFAVPDDVSQILGFIRELVVSEQRENEVGAAEELLPE